MDNYWSIGVSETLVIHKETLNLIFTMQLMQGQRKTPVVKGILYILAVVVDKSLDWNIIYTEEWNLANILRSINEMRVLT